MRRSRQWYIDYIRNKFNNDIGARKFITVIRVAIEEDEKLTYDEFLERFNFMRK